MKEEDAELSENLQKTFAFLIGLTFTIIYIRSFCSKSAKEKANVDGILPIIAIIYVSVYTLRYFGTLIVWMIGEENIPSIWIDEILEYALFDLAFVIGHFCFVLLMILRLHTGFKGTMYETTKFELGILYSLLIILLLTNELFFVWSQNRYKEDSSFYHDKSKYKYGVHTWLFLVLVILNVLIASMLIYKFNKNIWSLVQLRQNINIKDLNNIEPSETTTNDSSRKKSTMIRENATNIDNCQQSKHFLSIAIKFTLLCSIPMIFTSLQFAGWILLQFNMIKNESTIFWFIIIWDWLFDFVLICNFLCIFLSYPFAKEIYLKPFVCGYYHRKCENCCTFLVGATMLRKQRRLDSEKDLTESKKEIEL